jgi:acyl carrier protein
MKDYEILRQVNEIFKDVLENENIVLTNETNADSLEEWDSLNHIQLVVAIEKHFRQRFTASEIQNWKNVGEMCASIAARMKNG